MTETLYQHLDSSSFKLHGVKKKGRLLTFSIRVGQFLTWPFLYVIFHTLFVFSVRGGGKFRKIKSPFILIANHISFYDSFTLRLALGLFTPHLPLRFMAVREFDSGFLNFLTKLGITDFIYKVFGVFTIVQGQGIERGLINARNIISLGGNVVIYPEGQITKVPGSIGPFKMGVAVLARQTNAKVVPICMKLEKKSGLRKSLTLIVGDPIQVDVSLSPREVTDGFHKVLSGLYSG